MNQIAISVKGVSKKYSIGKQKDGSLRGTLTSLFAGGKNSQEDFWALKNVSFDIRQGDVVGIVGKNGAGKSTLLKILSQITRPTTGEIELNGRVASLLEVGTGFHPELTGRENIFLNGTILGMTKKEVKSKFDEIVAFSGIEKFIDTPVKRYSSGMYVRLAFAVAAHLEPEILIIDEVLAVGDAEFQKKCLGKMKDVAGEGRTVIFVSHDTEALHSLCEKGVLLNSGEVQMVDTIDNVLESYLDNYQDSFVKYPLLDKPSDQYVELDELKIVNSDGKQIYSADISEEFGIEITYTIKEEGFEPCPNIHIYTATGIYCFVHVFEKREFRIGTYSARCWIPSGLLNNQSYFVGIAFTTIKNQHLHFFKKDVIRIEVIEKEKIRKHGYGGEILGTVRPDLKQEIEYIG